MSASGKEIELKFALADAAELEALGRALGGDTRATVRQINHFFDTPELDLHRAKHVLRLREEDGTGYLLTAKGPGGSEQQPMSERSEHETRLDSRAAKALFDDPNSAIAILEQEIGADVDLLKSLRTLAAGKRLENVGKFENTRTPIDVPIELGAGVMRQVTFELDRTLFPNGRVDFEVEIELQATAESEREELAQAIRAVVQRAGISPRSAPSKAKRFFETLLAK